MWLKAVLLVLACLALLAAALTLYGKFRWASATRELRAQLEVGRRPVQPALFDPASLAGLPAPVQRYFRTVLREGQPMIGALTVEHTGSFNIGQGSDNWKPFTSTQRVTTQRPGFLWDARVAMAPGLHVYVHDAYIGGVGILHPAILGLITLMDMRGTGVVAEGELMRFFAEAAWYPTALLPNQGVRWEVAGESSALGALTEDAIALTMLFSFDSAGLIEKVRAEARGRAVGREVIPTPWEGRLWNYESRNGMKVPMSAEVAWILPEGPKPYWRGRITRLEYE